MTAIASRRRGLRRKLAAALGAAVVLVLAGAFVLARAPGLRAGDGVPTFVVQRGPLTISVIESGTIKPQDQISLKSEVEGQTTLIYLIPEGTPVTEGQLLAELDASKLQDDRVEQQIRVDNAEAEFIRASENLDVVTSQAQSEVSKAELAYRFAREDEENYRSGEYPQQLLEAEAKITIAEEEMKRAAEKLRWSELLFSEKYISQTERDADRLTHKRAELDYQLAVAAKKLLETYTRTRRLAQLESDVEQAEMALERARLKANADIVQAEATLRAKEAEYRQQQSKLAKLDEQISKSRIYAPRDGLVIYATSTRVGGGRGGMTQPLEEGQTVRERQELIYLPSTQAMMAELMIHESSLEKVRVGQPVVVTVDAMPGRTFPGRVRSIAPLPDAQSMWMNPDRKVYATRVLLEGNNAELRNGMSCRAEIIIDRLDDAIYVPLQAVVRVAGEPTVYVRKGDRFEPRTVAAGLDNSSMIHIVSGLSAGEVVSLAPPLETGATRFAAAAPVAAPAGPPLPANGPAPALDEAPGPGRPGPSPAPLPDADGIRAGQRPPTPGASPDESAGERRRRWEAMTPEQRAEIQRRMRERQSGGDAPGNDRPGGDPAGGDPAGPGRPP